MTHAKFLHLRMLAATGILSIVGALSLSIDVRAALVPSLSLSNASVGSAIQITVFGADPNASVTLYYPSTNAVASAGVGQTNGSGYLTTTVNPSSYPIASGANVYVVVDSQASPSVAWPNSATPVGTTGNAIPLSQTAVNLNIGQTSTVTGSATATLSILSNSNPAVATANVANNQITITANGVGATNLSVCAAGYTCTTVTVTVQSSASAVSQGTISFNPTSLTLSIGQTQTIIISGSGGYFLSGNSNSASVSASINGSNLVVSGVNAGSGALSICANVNGSLTCANMNVSVVSSVTPTPSATPTPLTFGSNNITLNIGQMQNVPIIGGLAPYYVSTNQAPSSIVANISGQQVALTGLAFGGSNISVCSSATTQCGTFYAYVMPAGSTNTASAAQSTGGILATTTAHALETPILPANGPATSTKSTFKHSLHIGSKGVEVRQLQNRLTELGFYSGPVTGTFGAQTRAAVKALQKAHHLESSGVVGPATRKLLNKSE